jgi:phosphorylcholine metabolism protein LicD
MIYSKKDREDLLSHLAVIVDILNKHNIHFWVFAGAVLGYVRDGELIPWDPDIDLCYLRKDFLKMISLRKEFKKAGFKFLTKERSARFDWEGSKGQHIGNACIDLEGDCAVREPLVTDTKFGRMIYFGLLIKAVRYNMNNTYRFLRWLALKSKGCHKTRLVLPSHFYLNLKTIDFHDIKLKIPAETEEYLDYVYKDWRTPQKWEGIYSNYNKEYYRK